MAAQGREFAWAGDPELLIEAYQKTGGKIQHPMAKIKAVLDAARKSDLFEKCGYVKAHDCRGNREIHHPLFKVKTKTTNRDRE